MCTVSSYFEDFLDFESEKMRQPKFWSYKCINNIYIYIGNN